MQQANETSLKCLTSHSSWSGLQSAMCLWEFEISEVANEVLDDDIMWQGSSGDDWTQLVTSGTHTINNNSVNNDGDNEERTVTRDEQGEGCP
jgi:hypothetical protein